MVIAFSQFLNRGSSFLVRNPGEYQLLTADANGIIQSLVFPGLWLAVEALLNNQMTQVLAVLQTGLNSTDHAEFVKQLDNRK